MSAKSKNHEMLDCVDHVHMANVLDQLCKKSLELTGRNSLISFTHGLTRKNYLRVIDERYDFLFSELLKRKFQFKPLPGLEELLPDETTAVFNEAADSALAENKEYSQLLGKADDSEDEEVEFELNKLVRKIKDQVRLDLGLKPRPKSSNDLSDLKNLARIYDFDPSYDLEASADGDAAHTDKFIQSIFPELDLNNRLNNIYNAYKRELTDRSINPLYLVFGFLNWKDAKGKSFNSPLLLMPVVMDRKSTSLGYKYTITLENEPIINEALKEKIHNVYGMKLPDLGDYESDEFKLSKYFKSVRRKIANKPDWKLKTNITFTPLKHSSISIYEDLKPENWGTQQITSHENLSKLLKGREANDTGRISLEDYEDIDEKITKNDCPHLFLNSDSSQYNAIIKILEENPLIIQGPPGTGKSQTISNAIAVLASRGKKILFVAEKAAAINQISKNLNKIGLGDLLFEAHADIKKDKMYDSLGKRLKLEQSFNKSFYKKTNAELVTKVAYLKEYKEFLFSDSGFNELRPNQSKTSESLTYYELIGRFLSLSDRCKVLQLPKTPVLKQLIICDYNEYEELDELVSSIIEHGRLENEKILQISNLASDQISISVFEEETEKINESVTDFLSFYNSSDYKGSMLSAISFIKDSAVVDEDILALKQKLGNAVASALKIELNKEFKSFKEIYLPEISVDLLEGVESSFRNLGVSPLTQRELSNLQLEAASIRSDIVYALNLKEDISYSKVSSGIADRDIIQIISNVQNLDFEILSSFNKNIKFDDDFDLEDFTDFKNLLDRIDDLIMSFTGSKSKKNIKQTKSKIGKINSVFLGESQANIPKLKVLEISKDIYSNRNIFSFFSKRYRGTIALLESFGFNPKNEDDTKRGLSELIECLELYDELNDNSMIQFFSDENQLLKLNKSDVIEFSSAVIDPMKSILGVVSDNSIKLKILSFIIQFKSYEFVNLKALDSNDIDLKHELDECENRIENLQIVEDFYKKNHLKKKDAKLNMWSSAKAIEHFNSSLIEILPKERIIDPEIPEILEIKDQVISYIDSENEFISLHELFSFLEEVETEDAEDIYNQVEVLTDKVLQNYNFFKELGLDESQQSKYFESKIHKESHTYISVLEHIQNYFSKYFESVDASLAEDELFSLIEFFSSLDGSELSSLLCQSENEIKIKNSKFESLINSEYFTQTRDKNLLMDFCHLQLISRYLYENKFIKKNKILESYTRGAFEDNISKMSKAVSLLQDLERDKCLSEAAAIKIEKGINYGPKKGFTEESLIKNEVSKQRAKLSHRPLIKRASKALTAMKPIWLMTPQTVSDYLPREREMFDILIIDEASQMKIEHAIPSVMRAKQMVVVGDKQQMPPSNFFTGATDSEDDEIEEESILDACESTLGKTIKLNYHYRSRHQNLIQFSNHHFYDNELNIVNSAKIESNDLGVKLVYVEDGVYRSEKSSGKNEIEADKVIEIIDQCIKDFPERSIGVVTVNRAQQDLLEQKWDYHKNDNKAAKDFTEYWEREENKSEIMIFRNLERIQGDERDIIIISTVYGKNENNKIMQRFGPILSKSGHRRLNVLFTRAKSMLYLVTSLQPGDVKAPGNSRGKEIFHKYLHYSADPNKNLIIGNAEGDPDSDFEVFVANKIRQYGYEVDYQIGVNGFKIDLGIRDPRDSSVYIAGIECDGATFHSSPQARDRDILRQEILEDYGWRIFRIWSTDWFRDSDGEIAKLMSWLKDIRDPVPSSEPTSKEIDGSELKLYNEGDGSTAVWCNSKYVCTILKLERRDSYAANLLMSRSEGKGFHATSKLLSYYMIEGIDELEGKEYGTYNEAEKASVSYLRPHLK